MNNLLYPYLSRAIRDLEGDNGCPRGHFRENYPLVTRYLDAALAEKQAEQAYSKTFADIGFPDPSGDYPPDTNIGEFIATGGEHTLAQQFLAEHPEYKEFYMAMDLLFGESTPEDLGLVAK